LSLQDTFNPPVHLRLRAAAEDEVVTRLALRAALTAVRLLGLAAGTICVNCAASEIL
jgi:hypothetical protein